MKLVEDLPLVLNSEGTVTKQRDPNCLVGKSVSAGGLSTDVQSRGRS